MVKIIVHSINDILCIKKKEKYNYYYLLSIRL